jgi:GAF domain-containing protein
VAMDVTTDPVVRARRLRLIHERELGGDSASSADVREVVRESWRRSLAAGVAPDQGGAPMRLAPSELERRREQSPLAAVIDVIHSKLASLDEDARHIVAIADAEANLLWVTGDTATCERAREMGFQEGGGWSENAAGTNALGTALALDHPVQIFSAEHVIEAVHPWTCSAAPIHDPGTGKLIGVVDLTADLRTHHPHTLPLAELTALAAESALHLGSLEVTERLRERWETAMCGRRTPSALLDRNGWVIAARGMGELPRRLELTVDGDGRTTTLPDGRGGEVEPVECGGAIVWLRRRSRPRPSPLRLQLLGQDASAEVGTGRRERGLRSLELLAVLSMHPEGMTTEQLMQALYGERGKAVTIRAQVHRIRVYLGARSVETHPYRLNLPVEADWAEVRRLVSAGRPGEALRVYRGPLLPASDAPEIVETRALLEESLRRSILTTADPDLLSAWLEHPSGADDLAAARALVAVLPCGDPRRAAATATAAAIARRLSRNAS